MDFLRTGRRNPRSAAVMGKISAGLRCGHERGLHEPRPHAALRRVRGTRIDPPELPGAAHLPSPRRDRQGDRPGKDRPAIARQTLPGALLGKRSVDIDPSEFVPVRHADPKATDERPRTRHGESPGSEVRLLATKEDLLRIVPALFHA